MSKKRGAIPPNCLITVRRFFKSYAITRSRTPVPFVVPCRPPGRGVPFRCCGTPPAEGSARAAAPVDAVDSALLAANRDEHTTLRSASTRARSHRTCASCSEYSTTRCRATLGAAGHRPHVQHDRHCRRDVLRHCHSGVEPADRDAAHGITSALVQTFLNLRIASADSLVFRCVFRLLASPFNDHPFSGLRSRSSRNAVSAAAG